MINDEYFLGNTQKSQKVEGLGNKCSFLPKFLDFIMSFFIEKRNEFKDKKQIRSVVTSITRGNTSLSKKTSNTVRNYLLSENSIINQKFGIGRGLIDRDRHLLILGSSSLDYADRELHNFVEKFSSEILSNQELMLVRDTFRTVFVESLKVEKSFSEELLAENELSSTELYCISQFHRCLSDKKFKVNDNTLLKNFIKDIYGNKSFNARIKAFMESDNEFVLEHKKGLRFLVDYSYKTQFEDVVFTTNIKLNRILENNTNYKKLSLNEIYWLDRISEFTRVMKTLDKLHLVEKNSQQETLFLALKETEKNWKSISKKIKSAYDFREGDILMYDATKFTKYIDKKIEKMVRYQNAWLGSKEFHAAMIDITQTKKGKSYKIAHIVPDGYKLEDYRVGHHLFVKTYRLQITKLVSISLKKKIQSMLRQTGRKEVSWKEYVNQLYQDEIVILLQNKDQFKTIKNPPGRRLKSIVPFHKSKIESDFSSFTFEDKTGMICSEFVAAVNAVAISRINSRLQDELNIHSQDVILNPIDKFERLDRVHTSRLIEILNPYMTIVERPQILNDLVDFNA